MPKLEKFLKKLGIKPKKLSLYQQAFVHRSYLNENPQSGPSNERLEFLGDAVLELLITEYLFNNIPQKEGDLSAIRAASVRTSTLAVICQKIGLSNFLLLSKGEDQTGGREKEKILADLFEAFIGAVFLDKGLDEPKKIFVEFLVPYVEDIIKNQKYIDPKTYFQEIAQAEWRKLPEYKLIEEKGPDHNKTFVISVSINNKILGKGQGPSKQRAEEEAARNALHKLENNRILRK